MSTLHTQRENLLLMLVLFLGYMMVIYVRDSVAYAGPIIAAAENLEHKDLGLIVSSQKLGYTIVKFLGGTLVDVLDPGLVLTVSLIISGIVGASFAACSSVSMFCFAWFLCGLVQGPIWPACALLMKNSFLPNQLATWWSILSASSNLAGSLGPLVSQSLNSVYPWRVAFLLGGTLLVIVGIFGGLFLFHFQKEKMTANVQVGDNSKERKRPYFRVLMNSTMLSVCLTYFLYSIIRGACTDWSQYYLLHNKKQTAYVGSRFISCQEIGGIVGSIVAGYMSDASILKWRHRAIPRVRIQCLFSILTAIGIFCLIFLVDASSSLMWINTIGFAIGFSLYGCKALIGIVSMEVAPDNLAGTAQSLATLASNIGHVFAGFPLTLIASYFSWHESFLATLLISLMSVGVTFILLHLIHTRHQPTDQKKKS